MGLKQSRNSVPAKIQREKSSRFKILCKKITTKNFSSVASKSNNKKLHQLIKSNEPLLLNSTTAAVTSKNRIKRSTRHLAEISYQKYRPNSILPIVRITNRMNSPFRSLRRSSTHSPINCCSPTSVCGITGQFSYPYPRNHSMIMFVPTTLRLSPVSTRFSAPNYMVSSDDNDYNGNNNLLYNFPFHNSPTNVLNNNPNEGDEQVQPTDSASRSVVSQYGFSTHRPRPPLNRAIPPIPESKSNESIMSATANAANKRSSSNIAQITSETIDESPMMDLSSPQLSEHNNEDATTVSGPKDFETNKHIEVLLVQKRPSRLPMPNQKQAKREKRRSSSKEKLVSMAHSVGSRLSKLGTRFGSRNRSTSPVSNRKNRAPASMPMSKSLSGSGMRRDVSSAEFGKNVCLEVGERKPSVETSSKTTKSVTVKFKGIDNMESPEHKPSYKSHEIPRRMPACTLIPGPIRTCTRYSSQQQRQLIGDIPSPTISCTEEQMAESGIVSRVDENIQISRPVNLLMRKTELESIPFEIEVESQHSKLEIPLRNEPVVADLAHEKNFNNGWSKPLQTDKAATSDVEVGKTDEEHDKIVDMVRRPRVAGSDLFEIPKIPRGMRYAQSFPPTFIPMGRKKSDASDKALTYHSKSALTVSFNNSESEKYKTGKIDIDEPKHRMFSTRSLRLVATKVYEASPILCRRRRASTVTAPTISSQQKSFMPKKCARMRRAESHPREKPIHSVEKSRFATKHKAPLAVFESMRIENSPAIEIPPFALSSSCTKPRQRASYIPRFLTQLGTKKSAKQKTLTSEKEEQNNKIQVKQSQSPATKLTVPNSSSRPTLAELLASPLTVRRETVPTSAPDSQRSGLIDDEIGDQPMLISTADLPLIDEMSCCSASPFSHRYHSHSQYSIGANDTSIFKNHSHPHHNEVTITERIDEPPDWSPAPVPYVDVHNGSNKSASSSLLLITEMQHNEGTNGVPFISSVETRMEKLQLNGFLF